MTQFDDDKRHPALYDFFCTTTTHAGQVRHGRDVLKITPTEDVIKMDKLCVLVANEPRSYRTTMALAFRRLRPELEVITVEAADLDREVLRLRPDIVVCSLLTEMVDRHAHSWVVLYPKGQRRVLVSINGQRTTLVDVELAGLVAIIDQTKRLTQMD